MGDVKAAIERAVGVLLPEEDRASGATPEDHEVYVRECREFLARQERTT